MPNLSSKGVFVLDLKNQHRILLAPFQSDWVFL